MGAPDPGAHRVLPFPASRGVWRGAPLPAPTDEGARPERPIRVCLISPLGYGLYNPESGYPFGGAEVQFFLLARELSADPILEVLVLTTVAERPGAERYGSLTLVKRRGRKRLAVPAGRGWLARLRAARRYGAAFFEMRRLMRTIDADVYLHAGSGVEVGAYALICRLLRRRFVWVVASSEDLARPGGLVTGPLQRLFPTGVILADAVVCRTKEQQRLLRTRYRRDGVLIRTGHPVAPQAPDRKSTVLWVGRIHPIKQPELFLALAERLPQEPCVMVAMRNEAHEGLWNVVRDRAAALPNLTVHEDVPWHEVGRLFEDAKLLVNTSTYEGFPNTFVQAALHGTPILSWGVDPDGVLSRQEIGRCAGRSFDVLVEEATRLCRSVSLREELGARARRYASAHHDLNLTVDRFKRLVKSLARVRWVYPS